MIVPTRPLARSVPLVPLTRPEGLRSGVSSRSVGFRESSRSFAVTALWMTAFLGGGYLLLWKPVLDRWVF